MAAPAKWFGLADGVTLLAAQYPRLSRSDGDADPALTAFAHGACVTVEALSPTDLRRRFCAACESNFVHPQFAAADRNYFGDLRHRFRGESCLLSAPGDFNSP
jgi:hypothetical protein